MSRKIPLSRRPPSNRHTLSEREWIIAQYDDARDRGLAPADAIKGLDTSLASVHRWKRTQPPPLKMPAPTFAQGLSIDYAIARLADTTNDDRLSFLEALFKFTSWLRWPNQTDDHPAAITVCVIAYLSQKGGADTIDQLNPEDKLLIQRHLRLDTLKRIFSEPDFILPTFERWYFGSQKNYDRSDLLADVAWFMVAYKPPSKDPREAPSLNKVYYATQNKVFKYRWHGAHRKFRQIWLDYGAASPFHYVERYHPSIEFTLDPSSKDFAEGVDEILQRPDELRIYLGRCRSAVNLLLKRLDRRALKIVRFPRFPDELAALPIEPPNLPAITAAIMEGFISDG